MTANVSYGIDVASYQAGLNMAEVKGEGFTFAYVKATQGINYVDPDYAKWAGNPGGLHEIPYHYVTNDDQGAQADYLRRIVGLGPTECMLDEETGGSSTVAQIAEMIAQCKAVGFTAIDLYLPHWRWLEIGSPDISKLQIRYLIASDYPNNLPGYASALYPGDGFSGWNEYGDRKPDILQFTDKATVGGKQVDGDAASSTVTWTSSTPVKITSSSPPGWSATVKQVQTELNRWPFSQMLAVDGELGDHTKDAIVTFQHASEIAGDGVVGPITWSKLNTIYDATRPQVRSGNTGAEVKWVQTRLNSIHGYGLKIDGQFGPATKSAVERFQTSCELASVDGVAGKDTNAALQL